MKELKRITVCLAAGLGIVWAGLVFSGCQTEPVFARFPEAAPASRVRTNALVYNPPAGPSDALMIGDVVTIAFNSGDSQPLPMHQEAIKDDGKITPPYVGSIVANGKSPGALQAELQKLYNVLYKNMTVTVTSKDRYYYVSGEVKAPGPKPYLGDTDILKAISSASDFTEFAKKTQVRINRANGKTETIDYNKAIEDPKQNVAIYPGDKIFVPRRLF